MKQPPMAEEVLVVSRQLFCELGYFQGFSPEAERYLSEFLRPGRCFFLPRSEAEANAAFKQLIPYVLIMHKDHNDIRLFQYRRGLGQGESRLHAKRSVGIGGHINPRDLDRSDPSRMYDEALRRELAEEVVIHTEYHQRCVGLINDDETEVGRVHLGVVHILEVAEPRVEPAEPDICEACFRPVAELLTDFASFESWSQICLKALFAGER